MIKTLRKRQVLTLIVFLSLATTANAFDQRYYYNPYHAMPPYMTQPRGMYPAPLPRQSLPYAYQNNQQFFPAGRKSYSRWNNFRGWNARNPFQTFSGNSFYPSNNPFMNPWNGMSPMGWGSPMSFGSPFSPMNSFSPFGGNQFMPFSGQFNRSPFSF